MPEAMLYIAGSVAKHIQALSKDSRSMTKRCTNFTDTLKIRMPAVIHRQNSKKAY